MTRTSKGAQGRGNSSEKARGLEVLQASVTPSATPQRGVCEEMHLEQVPSKGSINVSCDVQFASLHCEWIIIVITTISPG